jgi:hypothetical protein
MMHVLTRLGKAWPWGTAKPPPAHLSTTTIDWQQFKQYMLQRMTPLVVEDRLRYAKQYASILIGNVDSNILNQLSPNKRIHIMKALSSLARFTGKTEEWRQIRQQYQLSWSTGTEKLDAFQRVF